MPLAVVLRCGGLLFLVTAPVLFAGAPPAPAASAPVPHGTVELLAEHRVLTPGQQTTLALRFVLEEGWHIYWQNPGDSGQPPRVRWQLPPGLAAGEIQWPVPQRIQTAANIVDYGYHGTVLLLVPLRAAESLPVGPATIGAQLNVVVCREICIAGTAEVSLTLPVRAGNSVLNPALRRTFERARQALPRPAPPDWQISASQSRESVVLQIETGAPVPKGFFFPWEESRIENSAPQVWEPLAGGSGIRMTLRTSSRLRGPLERLRGVLALEDGRAYLLEAPVVQQGRN